MCVCNLLHTISVHLLSRDKPQLHVWKEPVGCRLGFHSSSSSVAVEMDAVTSFKFLGYDRSLPFVPIKFEHPNFSSHSFRYKFVLKCGGFTLPRLRISYRGNKGPEQCFGVPIISSSMGDSNGGEYEGKKQSFSNDCEQEAVIDLKLPRRSLLVTFTCDACGTRSQRLINRLAYERGLVYVQCSGCSQYHKLVDNLGLVIEYNLQEEIDSDANMDQV